MEEEIWLFLEWGGEGGHTYRGLRLVRRDNSDRLLTTNVDAFHSFSVKRGPIVENCEFAFMGDDFFNVHNRVYVIYDRPSQPPNSLRIIDTGDVLNSASNDTPTYTVPVIGVGDYLKFYGLNTRTPKGRAIVDSMQSVTDPNDLAAAGVLYLTLNKSPYNAGLVGWDAPSVKMWVVTFSSSTPLDQTISNYDLVQFDTMSSNGALVRNNYFHDSYDNCMRLQSSNTMVANNTFEHASSGIQVVFDQPWLEGSLGLNNITIEFNKFVSVVGCTDAKSCITIDPDVTNVVALNNTFT